MNYFRRWLPWLWLALVALAPFGTRLIFRAGSLGDAAVEWGTISLHATQLLAVAVIVVTGLVAGTESLNVACRTKPARVAGWLLAAALFSTLFAGDFFYALNVVVWLAIGYGLLVTASAARLGFRPIALGLVIGGLLQAALAASQFLTQSAPASKWLGLAAHAAATAGTFVVETADGRWLRAYGSFGHPNALGLYLALALVVAVSWVAATRGRARLVWLAALPLLTFGLFCSFAKSAALALVVGLAALLIRRSTIDRRTLWLPVAVIVLTLGVGTALFSDLITTRLQAQGRLERRSYAERIDATTDTAKLFLISPLFGIGPGNMPQAIIAKLDADRSGWSAQPVHVVPLLILVELGLLGFVAWLALIVLALRAALRRGNDDEATVVEATMLRQPLSKLVDKDSAASFSRCLSDASAKTLLATLLATLLTFSIFDHFLWTVWPGQLLFWLLLAGVFAEE